MLTLGQGLVDFFRLVGVLVSRHARILAHVWGYYFNFVEVLLFDGRVDLSELDTGVDLAEEVLRGREEF